MHLKTESQFSQIEETNWFPRIPRIVNGLDGTTAVSNHQVCGPGADGEDQTMETRHVNLSVTELTTAPTVGPELKELRGGGGGVRG